MNAYLVCLSEHSMNASTFSARVTISTISDIYAAISTALGTLKGDAHGGANQMSMEMLLDIGAGRQRRQLHRGVVAHTPSHHGSGAPYLQDARPACRPVDGPLREAGAETGNPTWHNLAHRLEEITSTNQFFLDRKLFPNVEFYSAPLLYMLGMTTDMMPGAFAISRIGGWSAQVLEQLEDNRLIRPSARYTGPESQTYVPIDQRG